MAKTKKSVQNFEEASKSRSNDDVIKSINENGTKIFDKVTRKINTMAGGTGAVKLSIKDLFSDVFKKHSPEASEKIFISGTSSTTPKLHNIDASWPKPWLYSRIFAVFAIAFVLLDICCSVFQNINALPGVIIIGSFMVPFSLLVFFFEVNAPRNISFFNIIKTFLIGGCASLVFTLILFEFFTIEELDYFGAIMVGIVEELGKLGIVYFFIKKTVTSNYITNGLLIGAAVGAGFAAFESAGYALNYEFNYGYEAMMDVIFLRAVLAPGGHIAWAAITGAALMISKGDHPLSIGALRSSKFLKFFLIPIALHSIWDMPIEIGSEIHLIQIILLIASWIVILVLISSGLKQITNMIAEEKSLID